MFLVNSCLGLFTAASFEAPLFPKLRGQLAEFLNNPSPVGLRILSSSTCVGLRYGPWHDMLSGFSREPDYHRYPIARGLSVLSRFSSKGGFACPPLSLRASTHYSVSARMCHFSVSTIARVKGNRIFTVCPSASPCGFVLGPDLP